MQPPRRQLACMCCTAGTLDRARPLITACSDNSFRSTHSQRGLFENTASQISFTSNSDSSVSAGRYHKNFDIHLAQIDIETFTSEDIERISHNSFSRPMEDSADTLRLVLSSYSAACTHCLLFTYSLPVSYSL